jgi:hypothetical protein
MACVRSNILRGTSPQDLLFIPGDAAGAGLPAFRAAPAFRSLCRRMLLLGNHGIP